MDSEERHKAREKRRKEKRERHRCERNEAIGELENIFSYHELYNDGLKCCNGVRWKHSVQNFELHLFSETAKRCKEIKNECWRPGHYSHFTLCERGKAREIDAPHIKDRQVHKGLTKRVLKPIYLPTMIYDNGASLPGKGLDFSYSRLKDQIHWFYRRYGTDGYVIKIDLKNYFPSAPRENVIYRHQKYIYNEKIRSLADNIIYSFPGERGLLLGVEPSQLEMIAFPSSVDNFIKCQLGIHCASHYMDDYIIIIPTKEEARDILSELNKHFNDIGLLINDKKSYIQPLSKPFRFCKVKFHLLPNGKIITHGCSDGMKRARRKMKHFKRLIDSEKIDLKYVSEWLKTVRSYYEKYNDHGNVLKLNRMYHAMFMEDKDRKDSVA